MPIYWQSSGVNDPAEGGIWHGIQNIAPISLRVCFSYTSNVEVGHWH